MAFNTWPHGPMWLRVPSGSEGSLGAVVHSWEQERMRGCVVRLGLGSKIISHELSVRDATGSGVSRAHGLTCHRH